MNITYFCDTSAIIKLYHREIGTNWMEHIFNDKESTIIISELSTLEFYSALSKKVRIGEITDYARKQAVNNFQNDCKDRFIVTPLGSMIITRAREIVDKYGSKYSIRTLDAIQISACLLENFTEIQFVCSDLHLIKICRLENLLTANPEKNEQ